VNFVTSSKLAINQVRDAKKAEKIKGELAKNI